MESDSDRLSRIEFHLDAVAGSQAASFVVLSFLLDSHKLSPQAIEAMTSGLERSRANMLSSSASDYKIEAFDAVAESLIAKLT